MALDLLENKTKKQKTQQQHKTQANKSEFLFLKLIAFWEM